METILSKSNSFKEEYSCSVVKINELIPVESSDFLVKTNILGTQIVINKNLFKEGDIVFYASNETALNERFLSLNNLFEIGCREKNANYEEVKSIMDDYDKNYRNEADVLRKKAKDIKSTINTFTNNAAKYNKQIEKLKKELEVCDESKINEINTKIQEKENKVNNSTATAMKLTVEYTNLKNKIDELVKAGQPIVDKAKKMCGFFNKYGRVRCITLRNEPSFGFIFSLNEMVKYCPEMKDINLEEHLNEDFDTVNGELFVKAFVPPIKPQIQHKSKTNKSTKKLSRFDRLVEGEFAFHYDTQQLGKNIHIFNPNSEVTCSVKIHGCVEYNTIVNTMEFGDLKIGYIVNNKINCHIKARDIENNEDIYVPIDNYFKIENDGEWYEIELENGIKIIITGNNPIWLPTLNTYRRVEDLDGNESLLISM